MMIGAGPRPIKPPVNNHANQYRYKSVAFKSIFILFFMTASVVYNGQVKTDEYR